MPKIPAKKIVEEAIAALNGVRREWLRRPGVTAVDVGFKIKDGTLTDDIAIRAHVARKIPVAELASSEMFNDTDKTPKKVGGFPVDVIEAVYGPSDAAATEPMVLEDANDVAIAAIDVNGGGKTSHGAAQKSTTRDRVVMPGRAWRALARALPG